MTVKCVVPGCEAECQTLHRFPSPTTHADEFKRWLAILHMDALYSLTPENVYADKRICSVHFDAMCPDNSRMHVNAVPTISLPVSQILITEELVPGSSTAVSVARAVHRRVLSTSNAQKLYKVALQSKSQATRSRKHFKRRLDTAKEYTTMPHLKKPCLTLCAERYFRKQMRKGKKQPGGCQFTQHEKTLSLTLLKNNPKSYDLLQQIFTLPDKQTLTRFLGRMTLNCGINEDLFDVLKEHVVKLEAQDKYCVVMFDEIRLQAQLCYNKKEDMIDGFVDTGRRRSAVLADRALVFMVRGLHRSWKQPIAFSFTQGATTSAELVHQISAVLESLFAIGLRPVATVCDQAGANVAAVNTLLRATEESYRRRAIDWPGGFFTLGDQMIVPLYDMPHLLTGIRNNMLSKVLRYTQEKTMEAKWEHVVALYELDKQEQPDRYMRLVPKLTDAHVYPTQRQKRQVNLCSQVFSQQVAAAIHLVEKLSSSKLGPGTNGTAILLLFFDKLFDSVNSRSMKVPARKRLRAPLTRRSAHVKFWQDAIKVLSSMEFLDPLSGTVLSRPLSITNWIATLHGLQLLWTNLQAAGYKSLLLRRCNQEPLEHFFTLIRSQGARSVTPSCTAFIAATKTLTMNNYKARQSVRLDYEVDKSETALCTLEELFARPKKPVEDEEMSRFTCNVPQITQREITTNRSYYCCAFVIKRLRPVFKECKVCKTDLLAVSSHSLHRKRECNNRQSRLNYVSVPCATALVTVKEIVKQMLPKYCSHRNFRSNTAAFVRANVNFTFLTCNVHNEQLREIFIKKTIELILYGWIREINQILNGKRNMRGCRMDSIKKQALVYYKQKRKTK